MQKQRIEIDDKDKTAMWPGANKLKGLVCYFFRSKFKDGFILAWFSHSPGGHCQDQEQGWVIIDPTNKVIVDECETRTMGQATGYFRAWNRKVRAEHGKTVKVYRNESGEFLWSIARDT